MSKTKKPKQMTGDQYRESLEKLGMNLTGECHKIGVSPRHSQRLAAGSRKVSKPLAKLLRLAILLKVDLDVLESL